MLLGTSLRCASVCLKARVSPMENRSGQFRLGTFEKRLAIYNAATSFISCVMTSGGVTEEQLRNLILSTKEAKSLLSPNIAKYLGEELYAQGIDLQALSAQLEGAPISEERSTNIHEQRNIKL